MTIDLSTVPLVGISVVSKQIIAAMLNPTKVLPSDNDLPRDWRGLAHLLELNGEIMLLLVSHSDPTTYMLTMLEKNKKNITIKNFQTMMEQIDRWDIIDDTEAIFQSDAAKYLEQQQRAQESANLIDNCVDQEVLTLGDVHRLGQGLETQYYDAFLLYADEDVSFANEMVQKLETEYKLKLCLKDRDLVGGVAFEHEAVMKLISERCNRLLIIISPSFLESSANKFFLNYAQALSIEKRQRKIIPCIYESCELPFQLKYISTLDYNRRGLYDFWAKLCDSIQASNSVNTSSMTQIRNNITKEVTEAKRNILSDKHDDIPQNNQKISEETLKYLQKNENYTVAKINDAKDLNVGSKRNKKLLRLEKITANWKTKQTKQSVQATRDRELALTVEQLQDLHGSLAARPAENEKAEDPRGLKIQLMAHQKHALKWLIWREKQKPAGGVLADDMGLGKTLTMISLIMSTIDQKDSMDESDDNNDKDDSDDCEWSNNHKPLYHKGGTLVVCPASLLLQWDNEVRNRCKRGLLSVEIYHGSNRESVPKRLSKNDIVITTYNILSREHKSRSTLFMINWKRVILDEAHIVRNHKSQASLAVCGLKAKKRWALTGTPIQNKAMDLYSILKFLKCSPFDELPVWRRWVNNKNAAGHQRLATVMKSLMLRRTKEELIAKGDMANLPNKSIEEVMVKLDPQEQLVYEKILVYSRTLFAQFLVQRADKQHMFDLYGGKYDVPAYVSNSNKETQFTKAQNKLLAMHANVKTQILVSLRLRQLCCHPALIHAMLDQEDVKQSGIMDAENVDPDLLSRVSNISLNGIDNLEEENDIDERIVENLLTAENPVFDDDRISSKMKILLNMVEEILQKGEDKLIIVSQWATLLNVIASHLPSIKGATFSKFTGSVAIKDRQSVVESFNSKNSGPRILLLSLTAGRVGLNLVGGNHLLLFDIHWNPQLETQAQDRIYRFGQTKNVYIYKFICTDTIEERIKAVQERKLEIAHNVLSGAKNNAAMKLTLNDLKSLFSF